MNKKIFLIIIIAVILVFITYLWLNLSNQTIKTDNLSTTPTLKLVTVSPTKTLLPGINDLNKSPSKLEWKTELPTQTETNSEYRVTQMNTLELVDKLEEIFEFKEAEKYIDDIDVIWIKNKANKASFYLTKNDFRLHYQNVTGLEEGVKTSNKVNKEKIINDFLALANKLIIKQSGVKIEMRGLKYLREEGVRTVPALESEGQIVELSADLYINNQKVFGSSGGPWFYGQYSKGGQLLLLKTQQVMGQFGEGFIIKSMDVKNIYKLPLSDFNLFKIEGNSALAQTNFEENIEVVTITKVYKGLLYEANRRVLLPYIFLEGNSVLSTGPITVLMGVVDR